MMDMVVLLLLAAVADANDPVGEAVAARPCFATVQAIEAGQSMDRSTVAPVECTDPLPSRLLHYDPATRQVVARQSLPAETNLGHVWLPDAKAVRKGDVAYLHIFVGPIQLTRSVVAVQDARIGQSFFVRDSDGEVFRAPPLQAADDNQ